MTNKLVKKSILGAAFWKFLLLSAVLFFSYAIPAYADNQEETTAKGPVGVEAL